LRRRGERRVLIAIERVYVRPFIEQQLDDFVVAVPGGERQRRHPLSVERADIGALDESEEGRTQSAGRGFRLVPRDSLEELGGLVHILASG
jgi:hypothetical protein